MQKKSLLYYLVLGYFKSWGALSNSIGLVLAILALFVTPSGTPIPLNIFLTLMIFLVFLFTSLSRTLLLIYEDFSKDTDPMPRVIAIKSSSLSNENGSRLLLLEPSPLFVYAAVVSVFFLDGDYEMYVGIGEVTNLQLNKIIQIEVVFIPDFVEKLGTDLSMQKTFASSLLIKTTVPRSKVDIIQ